MDREKLTICAYKLKLMRREVLRMLTDIHCPYIIMIKELVEFLCVAFLVEIIASSIERLS
jgi:hypothetical protein